MTPPDETPSSSVGATLEVLPKQECLSLLAAAAIGRLAVVDGRQPLVVPVNFTYTADGIIIHTDLGRKLEAGRQHLVAFEVDEIDPETHLGWSVLVLGHAFDVTDTLDLASERLRAGPVDSWTPGPKVRRLLVRVESVTGRRMAVNGRPEQR